MNSCSIYNPAYRDTLAKIIIVYINRDLNIIDSFSDVSTLRIYYSESTNCSKNTFKIILANLFKANGSLPPPPTKINKRTNESANQSTYQRKNKEQANRHIYFITITLAQFKELCSFSNKYAYMISKTKT